MSKKLKAHAPWTFTPIGVIHTSFKEKFGIPRQPGLVLEAKGVIELDSHPYMKNAVKSLELFSHLWIVFVFHEHQAKDWKPSIRPPRLGGDKKVGVLASRSPHRPNPIGLSAVRLDKVEEREGAIFIHVSGVDILDGSPILDIKPYLPYADVINDANSGWADMKLPRHTVVFSEKSKEDLALRKDAHPQLEKLILEMLELDPRPASQRKKMPIADGASEGRKFGISLLDYDVKWEISSGSLLVTGIEDLIGGKPRDYVKPSPLKTQSKKVES